MNKLSEFSSWAESYNYFEGLGYLKQVKVLDKNHVSVILGYQVSGSLEANQIKICKESKLIFFQNIELEFNDKDLLGIENLLFDGIDFDENIDRPNFYINDPCFFRISADAVTIEEVRTEEYVVKPWLSLNEISFELKNAIPIFEYKFWVEEYFVFRIFGGDSIVPQKELQGYFIQQEERLKINKKGIFINYLQEEDGLVKLTLSLSDQELKPYWNTLLNKIVITFPDGKITSGNVCLTIDNWLKRYGKF